MLQCRLRLRRSQLRTFQRTTELDHRLLLQQQSQKYTRAFSGFNARSEDKIASTRKMSFHVQRTKTADLPVLEQYGGIRSTKWVKPPQGKSVLELQTTHTPTALQKIPEKLNYLTPPPHWHWYQDEYFHVKEGCYIFTLEGKDIKVSAEDPQPVHIPARARHTFKVDQTHEGPCTIEISTRVSPRSSEAEPEAEGASEKFFRNIYTYLDDCYHQGVSPALPQLLLQLHSAEISLALPGPQWLAHPLSYTMGLVIGKWYGEYLLGYKASYPEYWNGKHSKLE